MQYIPVNLLIKCANVKNKTRKEHHMFPAKTITDWNTCITSMNQHF